MAVGLAFSKKRVNRAGKLLREVRVALMADPDSTLDEFDGREIREAVTLVEWWRGLHARPLARVNASLRYYIRKADAHPEVTQRLKRFSTIVHKLQREPTMALTRMEDIGGLRAILPSLDQVLHVAQMLDKADRWRSAASASTSRAAIPA